MMSKEPPLSRRERQILDILHARGSATAAQVHQLLPQAPGYSAVRTLLRILGSVLAHAEGDHRRPGVQLLRARRRQTGCAATASGFRSVVGPGSLAQRGLAARIRESGA